MFFNVETASPKLHEIGDRWDLVSTSATPEVHVQLRHMRKPHTKQAAQGFTLIELIMVIVILGVLAVFAAPRMFDNSAFTGRGLHDETMALLRFGQKTAIAQRRGVCVTVNSTGITMTMFKDNPAPATCATATPAQVQALTPTFTPRGGTGLSSSTTPFQFTPLGSTDPAVAITLTVANSTPITVAPGTGYIHD